VLREVRNCEGSFEELRAAGAPPEGPSYADADAAAAVFSATAPIGLQRYETTKLVLRAAAAGQAAAGAGAAAGAEAQGE
jgi:type 2A phosphatase activator TIP41